mmetsp:Transcript_31642/g.65295  ORF Transcript_31642/g.65295 Transcript_31642/m.65295 type:complete len:218 (-) Transcript_31642:429-1082(-)
MFIPHPFPSRCGPPFHGPRSAGVADDALPRQVAIGQHLGLDLAQLLLGGHRQRESFVDMILAAPLAHHRHRKDQGIGDGVCTMVGPHTHRYELANPRPEVKIFQVIHDGPGRGHRRGRLPGLDDAGASRLHLLTEEVVQAVSSRDLGKRFALDDRMVHIWKLGVATPDHHISHVIHRQAKVMGDLPGGAILVQASEGKDVVLRQGGRILRTNPCVGM